MNNSKRLLDGQAQFTLHESHEAVHITLVWFLPLHSYRNHRVLGLDSPTQKRVHYIGAQNDVGAPPGRTEPGAATPPAAIAGTETPLSSNFAFGVPLVNLAGRGVDIKLALSYNSRLWHKSTDTSGAAHLTYDVDSGWPAPGFQLGYGYIESHGSFGMTLVDADGTRHELRKLYPTNPYDYN